MCAKQYCARVCDPRAPDVAVLLDVYVFKLVTDSDEGERKRTWIPADYPRSSMSNIGKIGGAYATAYHHQICCCICVHRRLLFRQLLYSEMFVSAISTD